MKVYLSEHIAPSALQRLVSHFEIVDNFDCPAELDAIITRRVPVTREIIEKADTLKIIAQHGVGLDRIDLEAAAEHNIPVTNVPGMGARGVAELAFSLFMALNRQLKMVNTGLLEDRFHSFGDERFICPEMQGKTLGLVGTGNIAKLVAEMMTGAFHMRLLAWNPRRTKEELAQMGFEKVESLEQLFSLSDYINISIILSDDTRNLINRQVLQNSKPGLILVNTSRGGIVNEADLYDALTNGTLRAAGLDVFETEPPRPDHPLLQLENFIGTFHIGGSTYESLERVGNIAVNNVFRYTGLEDFCV